VAATLLGIIFDVVAGLIVAGVLAALVVAALPTRPEGQAWLWLLAVASIVAVGITRRRLVAGGGSLGRVEWLRGIASRRGRRP